VVNFVAKILLFNLLFVVVVILGLKNIIEVITNKHANKNKNK